MRQSLFTRVLAVLLIVAMTIGHGPLRMAMAAPSVTMEQASMMASTSGMDMKVMASGAHRSQEKTCCSHSDKSHAPKSSLCGVCCMAAVQTAMLPSQFSAPVHYTVSRFYIMDTQSSTGKDVPPDPPRPKA